MFIAKINLLQYILQYLSDPTNTRLNDIGPYAAVFNSQIESSLKDYYLDVAAKTGFLQDGADATLLIQNALEFETMDEQNNQLLLRNMHMDLYNRDPEVDAKRRMFTILPMLKKGREETLLDVDLIEPVQDHTYRRNCCVAWNMYGCCQALWCFLPSDFYFYVLCCNCRHAFGSQKRKKKSKEGSGCWL